MPKRVIKSLMVLPLLMASYTASAVELHLYAGAGLRQPVESVVGVFEKDTGHKVVIEYGGSGQILTRFNLTKTGDVFLPGSEDYVEKLQQDGQVTSSYPLVYHTPVMAVRKATGGDVKTLADLAKSHLKIGMGDPKAIALGKSGEQLLVASGYEKELKEKVVVQATTIKQLLIYLMNGDVDAAVIGLSDAMKNQDTLTLLPSPPGTPEEVATIAVLKTSAHPDAAKQLAEFFASPQGIKMFTDQGYLPIKKH
ncbi:molybdate ABC transporter substrate-binding protein [Symbiopectobacterium purcellii]|uniref:Molybdate ABC transporter substrate-binding protein n=1 Tax=Symbiopectobacterium purcellii TaxID=2871826 RepID=A0ABX9AM16_9ENTR|nr:molybdate ABC transporter substrate-binding protein [Symbiopectobacterium purcellii]QZN96229.1 molybdate ABC transporter substrate-binding protein [Symbiopectobacterium purcellii]